MFIVMTSLLYDVVAINRTDVVIELCCWAHMCARRTDVRSSLGAPVALKELINDKHISLS